MAKYFPVIGLEIHCQLSTRTKMFCGCEIEVNTTANKHVCPVCLGMPGAMPVPNRKAVEYAIRLGLALNCEIDLNAMWTRKNYFYPDLPKGYQITQFFEPICENGYVKIGDKSVCIQRIHIEEDAGKLIHDPYTGDTLVDLNRCGVPLIEIVSEPDIRSKDEAIEYMQTLKSILEYIEVSDCKMQEGSLRADVNVSVRKKGTTQFGTRTEMKNLNSFKSVARAIEYEANRQIEELEKEGLIIWEEKDYYEKYFAPIAGKELAMPTTFKPEPKFLEWHMDEVFLR